jgi:tRNA-Thr(GGU) m(6)t(6)A37 methyltransferase TsaA
MELTAIGKVISDRVDAIDDAWDTVTSSIVLDASVLDPDAVKGLMDFSHVEVVYLFDQVQPDGVVTGSRHPRGNRDWPEVGILAQRARNRPNRIGICCCRLVAVDGLNLRVRDLDAIDGTPVLDIKPYMIEFGPRGPVHQPAWSTELMSGYWSEESESPG